MLPRISFSNFPTALSENIGLYDGAPFEGLPLLGIIIRSYFADKYNRFFSHETFTGLLGILFKPGDLLYLVCQHAQQSSSAVIDREFQTKNAACLEQHSPVFEEAEYLLFSAAIPHS